LVEVIELARRIEDASRAGVGETGKKEASYSRTNTGKPKDTVAAVDGKKSLSCFNCGSTEHLVAKCPEDVVKCQTCGWIGHKAENCTRNDSGKKAGTKDDATKKDGGPAASGTNKRSSLNVVVGAAPANAFWRQGKRATPIMGVKGELEKVKIPIYLDTCAAVSLIAEQFVTEEMWKTAKKTKEELWNADTKPLSCTTEVEATFLLGSKVYRWTFVVSKKLSLPVILGIDFLERWDVLISCGTREVTIRDEPLTDKELKDYREKRSDPVEELLGDVYPTASAMVGYVALVRAAEGCLIPANSRVCVKTLLSQSDSEESHGFEELPHDQCLEKDWWVKPKHEVLHEKGLVSWEGLTKCHESADGNLEVPVFLVNATNKDIKLKEGQVLGEAQAGGFELHGEPFLQLNDSVLECIEEKLHVVKTEFVDGLEIDIEPALIPWKDQKVWVSPGVGTEVEIVDKLVLDKPAEFVFVAKSGPWIKTVVREFNCVVFKVPKPPEWFGYFSLMDRKGALRGLPYPKWDLVAIHGKLVKNPGKVSVVYVVRESQIRGMKNNPGATGRDAAQGFIQVPIESEVAFTLPEGVTQFRVMPFVLWDNDGDEHAPPGQDHEPAGL